MVNVLKCVTYKLTLITNVGWIGLITHELKLLYSSRQSDDHQLHGYSKKVIIVFVLTIITLPSVPNSTPKLKSPSPYLKITWHSNTAKQKLPANIP